MSADIIQFIPRSNTKSDRAFWKGPESLELMMAFEALNSELTETDTAPCEMPPDSA